MVHNDLISRSALLEEFQFGLPINSERARVIARCVETARKIINEAPAVDAVEVVRCKDCRWYQIRKWDDEKPEYDCRKIKGLLDVKPDDFCSYVERRGDDQELEWQANAEK